MTEIVSNKDAYRAWAETQLTMPIFLQPWWMDAVTAGKEWDVLLVRRNETILAAMPYLIRKRVGLRFITMPQQTQLGGLWVNEHLELNDLLSQEVITELCKQLDNLKLAYYYQHWPLHSPLARRMHSHGYKVRERITYRIDDLHDTDAIVRRFSKNKRRQLQKAESLNLVVEENKLSQEDFYRFHRQCLSNQHKNISYTREFFLVLERKTRRLQQSSILTVSDQEGHIHAAAFLVWDKQTMYYLIPCFDPQYKDSGAGALLVLGALKLAQRLGRKFDFEGSMIRSVANHYRQFGSSPTLYCSVERVYKPIFRLLLWFNRMRERRL